MRLFPLLERAAALAPDSIATSGLGASRTWRQVHADALSTAGALASIGVGAGTRVAVLAMNDETWLDIYFAIWRLGAVAVPLNLRLSQRELEQQLGDCDAQVLISDGAFAAVAAALCRSLSIRHVSWAGSEHSAISLSELRTCSAPAPDSGCGYDDLAGIFYTGGTTGKPKGVLLSHSKLMLSSIMTLAEGAGSGRAITSLLHTAPLFHLSGAGGLINGTVLRLNHVFMAKFEPSEALRLIALHRPSTLMLAPVMLQMLLDHADFLKTDFSSVEYIAYGSAPMPEPLLRRAIGVLPKTLGFLQAYGMTESAGAVTVLGKDDHNPDGPHPERLRSAGRPTLCAEVKVVDANGDALPIGGVGEVWIRTPTLMIGYLNQQDETDKVLVDGWYRTGDCGRFDSDGYLYIVDRVKDMIVTGGENVYSAEVESALASHPAVMQVAVFGVPDDRWGERVHAEVLLKPGTAASADDLIAHCRTCIAGYKVPRSVALRDEPLPLSPAGKVQKNVLRAPFWTDRARQVN